MPGHDPIGCLGRALVDHRHIHQGPGTASVWAAAWLAVAPPAPQHPRQTTAQPEAFHAAADGFSTSPVRVLALLPYAGHTARLSGYSGCGGTDEHSSISTRDELGSH